MFLLLLIWAAWVLEENLILSFRFLGQLFSFGWGGWLWFSFTIFRCFFMRVQLFIFLILPYQQCCKLFLIIDRSNFEVEVSWWGHLFYLAIFYSFFILGDLMMLQLWGFNLFILSNVPFPSCCLPWIILHKCQRRRDQRLRSYFPWHFRHCITFSIIYAWVPFLYCAFVSLNSVVGFNIVSSVIRNMALIDSSMCKWL